MNPPRIAPRTAVLTGAPGAGKTTLLAELARRGFRVVSEAARAVLQAPGGLELRLTDPQGFAAAMFEREAASLEAVTDCGAWTIFDRGFGDSLGFLRLSGLPVPPEITDLLERSRYSGPVFFAPAWQAIYRNDSERIQTWDEALASADAVAAGWSELDYSLIELPLASPEVRADFIEAALSRA